ncbi:MAG: hypothetical protein WCF84_16605 [Anaerolineae bacterium]
MSRVWSLTLFLLKDFSRSLRIVVPPGLLLALYRVFFLYGSDVRYLGAVGAIMLGFICIVTTLLVIGTVNRASTYPLLARLSSRDELIAAIMLASFIITLSLAILFIGWIILNQQVPLQPFDLIKIATRWLVIFILVIAFALHLSKLVTRGGSNLVAYLIVVLSLVSYQRAEYPSFLLLDWTENLFTRILQPLTALISGGSDLITLSQYAIALAVTLLYSLLLYGLAIWLFRHKDLIWAE